MQIKPSLIAYLKEVAVSSDITDYYPRQVGEDIVKWLNQFRAETVEDLWKEHRDLFGGVFTRFDLWVPEAVLKGEFRPHVPLEMP